MICAMNYRMLSLTVLLLASSGFTRTTEAATENCFWYTGDAKLNPVCVTSAEADFFDSPEQKALLACQGLEQTPCENNSDCIWQTEGVLFAQCTTEAEQKARETTEFKANEACVMGSSDESACEALKDCVWFEMFCVSEAQKKIMKSPEMVNLNACMALTAMGKDTCTANSFETTSSSQVFQSRLAFQIVLSMTVFVAFESVYY